MLARTEPAERPEQSPAPEEKRRTVTLTNARPVTFLESQWPVVADGSYHNEHPGGLDDIKIEFRVRREQIPSDYFAVNPRHLIHGKFEYWQDDAEELCQNIRVGRLLDRNDHDLEKALLEVGMEMRERVLNQYMHRWVTVALDACFAKLSARVI